MEYDFLIFQVPIHYEENNPVVGISDDSAVEEMKVLLTSSDVPVRMIADIFNLVKYSCIEVMVSLVNDPYCGKILSEALLRLSYHQITHEFFFQEYVKNKLVVSIVDPTVEWADTLGLLFLNLLNLHQDDSHTPQSIICNLLGITQTATSLESQSIVVSSNALKESNDLLTMTGNMLVVTNDAMPKGRLRSDIPAEGSDIRTMSAIESQEHPHEQLAPHADKGSQANIFSLARASITGASSNYSSHRARQRRYCTKYAFHILANMCVNPVVQQVYVKEFYGRLLQHIRKVLRISHLLPCDWTSPRSPLLSRLTSAASYRDTGNSLQPVPGEENMHAMGTNRDYFLQIGALGLLHNLLLVCRSRTSTPSITKITTISTSTPTAASSKQIYNTSLHEGAEHAKESREQQNDSLAQSLDAGISEDSSSIESFLRGTDRLCQTTDMVVELCLHRLQHQRSAILSRQPNAHDSSMLCHTEEETNLLVKLCRLALPLVRKQCQGTAQSGLKEIDTAVYGEDGIDHSFEQKTILTLLSFLENSPKKLKYHRLHNSPQVSDENAHPPHNLLEDEVIEEKPYEDDVLDRYENYYGFFNRNPIFAADAKILALHSYR